MRGRRRAEFAINRVPEAATSARGPGILKELSKVTSRRNLDYLKAVIGTLIVAIGLGMCNLFPWCSEACGGFFDVFVRLAYFGLSPDGSH